MKRLREAAPGLKMIFDIIFCQILIAVLHISGGLRRTRSADNT